MSYEEAEIEHEVVMLLQQGMSRRAIARALHVGRNRVKEIAQKHRRARQQVHSALERKPKRAKRRSKLDPYRDQVKALLGEFEDITAQRVYEELKKSGYDGGDNIVKALVRKLRPKPKPRPSLQMPDYGPGKMAESDWSPYLIDFTHVPKSKMHAFCYVLSHSKRKAFSFHENEKQHCLFDGHVYAFERLKGVARWCKYDCQKAVVLRWEGRQPIYNPRFIVFATYYGFSPLACRPGKPNDKPNAERAFWELERSFLNGRKFRDEKDLRRQLVQWMDDTCDRRGKNQTVLERFEQDREHLLPLPEHPYDTARVVYRLCDIQGCISWEGNRYEVPYEYVTDILPLRVTAEQLYIYAPDLSLVAAHQLMRKGQGQIARLSNRKRPASSRRGADLEQLRQAYNDLGEQALSYFEGLISRHPRSAGYQAKKVLALRDRYSTTDLLKALSHTLHYRAFDHHAVQRVLSVRAEPRRLDEHITEQLQHRLQTFIGHSATQPRTLQQYDELPCFNGTNEPGEAGECQQEQQIEQQQQTSSHYANGCSNTPDTSD